MVVGFYISFDPPDALSVGLCIANGILPKEKWLARFDITTPWPCWGIPRVIHADNAKVFRGNMLKRACEEHGIDLQWGPVATPHWGGHIERLLGTFLREIHELPGTTKSNPKERGEYDSEKGAAMTLSEFEKWLVTFIVEVYHQRVHSSLKMSPIRKCTRRASSARTRSRALGCRRASRTKIACVWTSYPTSSAPSRAMAS